MFDPVSIAIQFAIVVAVNLIALALSAKNVEQGKLDSVDIDSASYGYALPRIWGSHYVTMQTVWIKDNKLLERKRKEKIGPFGLGGSITHYDYFVTAYLVGGIASGGGQLGRMWVNDELVADRRGDWLSTTTLYDGINYDGDSAIVPRGQSLDTKYWNWFAGKADQLPPASMIAAEGIDNCSGHRGVFGLEIVNLPLEKYGNGIPTIKCEVFVADTSTTGLYDLYAPDGDSPEWTSILDNKGVLWDWNGGGLYAMDPVSNIILLEAVYEDVTIINIEAQPTILGFDTTRIPVQCADNMLFALGGRSRAIYGFIKISDGTVFNVGAEVAASIWDTSDAQSAEGLVVFTATSPSVDSGTRYLYTVSIYTGAVISKIKWFELFQSAFGFTPYQPFVPQCFPITGQKTLVIWNRQTFYNEVWITLFLGGIPQWYKLGTALEGITADTGSYQSYGAFYNKWAGGVVVFLGDDVACVIDEDTGNKLYDLPFKSPSTSRVYEQGGWFNYNQPKQAWLAAVDFEGYTGNPSLILYDFQAREIIRVIETSTAGYKWYPTSENALVRITSTANQSKLFWYDISASSPVTVKTIVDDLIEDAGLESGYIDTSLATNTITGFKIDRTTSLKAIEDLVALFDYDLIDAGSNYILRPRNETVILSIDPDDLGASEGKSDGLGIQYKIASPYGMPKRIELTFADFEGDYENNMVYGFVPDDTVQSQQVGHLSTAVVLTAEEAKIHVYDAFSAFLRRRIASVFRLPIHKYAKVSVGDVIQISDPENNDTYAFKVESIGGAYALEINAIRSDAQVGVVPTIVATPRRTPEQTLVYYSPSIAVILDTNETRQDQARNLADDVIGYSGITRAYVSYYWNGASVFVSRDAGSTYDLLYTESDELPHGKLDAIPKTDATASVADTLSNVTVTMSSNSTFVPANATLAQLLDNELLNIAKIPCNDTSNDCEIVQYGEVTDNGDGSYTFGLLLRGRFGTEETISKHIRKGSIIFEFPSVPASEDDPYTLILGASDLNDVVTLATISNGQTSENLLEGTEVTFLGRNVMPYAVADLRAYTDSSGNIDVQWLRRDRRATLAEALYGTLSNAEASEEYEIDVYDGSTLVRTVTGLTTNSWQYTTAMQTTDGVDGNTVTFKVYQISAVVGRGRATELNHAA